MRSSGSWPPTSHGRRRYGAAASGCLARRQGRIDSNFFEVAMCFKPLEQSRQVREWVGPFGLTPLHNPSAVFRVFNLFILNNAHKALGCRGILFGPICEGIIFCLVCCSSRFPLCLLGFIGGFLFAFTTLPIAD